MAQFNTAGYQYNGEELKEVFLRPAFLGWLPNNMQPIYTDGAGSVKKTFFKTDDNYLMPYADGFQGGNDSTKVQKLFQLGEFKRENSYSAQDYKAIVQRQLDEIKRAFQNDIFEEEIMQRFPESFLNQMREEEQQFGKEAMMVTMAEIMLFQNSVRSGIVKTFWMSDTDKITYEGDGSTTKFPNGTVYDKYDADQRFNTIDGIWKKIEENASTTPTADQVQKVDMTNGAVAQVDTLTLTGTGGTANVTGIGITALATFDTDLTTTAANFVTANAAAFAAAYITLTSSGADLIFTSARKGVAFDAVSVANVSGDLSGSRAATTANVVAADMTANEARDKMRAMMKAAPRILKSINRNDKVFYATQSWIENYEDTLGADGTGAGSSGNAALGAQRDIMINGATGLAFNGIPIIEMPIDNTIEADFAGYSPHRCIYTTVDNLAPVLSTAGEFGEWALWWEKKDNANLNRFQCEMGADFVLPEYMVVAFQG